MNLYDIRKGYVTQKYSAANASSRTCQDVLLSKIAKSPLSKNVTIKGGVIISHLSKDKRRATRDFDLDFIRYSLDDDSIRKFIDKLNNVDDGITIEITDAIEELRHEEYQGKRNYRMLSVFCTGIALLFALYGLSCGGSLSLYFYIQRYRLRFLGAVVGKVGADSVARRAHRIYHN